MSLETLKPKVAELIEKAEWEKAVVYKFNNSGNNVASCFQGLGAKKIPDGLDFSTKTNCASCFRFTDLLEEINYYINSSACKDWSNALINTFNLKRIVGVDTSLTTTIAYMFQQSGIEEIDEPFNLTNVTNANACFYLCRSLKEIRFVPETIKISIQFGSSSLLSNESKQSIFDGLATVSTAQTLTLAANLKILQSQVDSANAKGWTVAGGTIVSEEEYYG